MSLKKWITIVVIQANLFCGMTQADFKQDLETIVHKGPSIVGLNEVDSRNAQIKSVADSQYYIIQHYWWRGQLNGQDGDAAILLKKSDYKVLATGVRRLHGDPPGNATARWATWAIASNLHTHRIVRVIAFHSLAHVEVNHHLRDYNRIKYYVEGIHNLVRLDQDLQDKARQITGRRGNGIMLGDLNWDYCRGSWLMNQMTWYVMNFAVLGTTHGTLGSRDVDYVMKHSAYLSFLSQYIFGLNSDHNGVLVRMKFDVR